MDDGNELSSKMNNSLTVLFNYIRMYYRCIFDFFNF